MNDVILASLDLLLDRSSDQKACQASADLLVSVIMPVFNRPQMVDTALESLRRQTSQAFEVIVVDDGSTDETSAVLKIWAAKVEWLKILTHEGQKGASIARNTGLAASCGHLIAYLDSDNQYYPHAIQTIQQAFRDNPSIWSLFTGHVWCHTDQQIEARCPQVSLSGLRACSTVADMNTFVHRRELYTALGGFDESLDRLSDWELELRYGTAVMAKRLPVLTGRYGHGTWSRLTNRSTFGWNRYKIDTRHSLQIRFVMRVLYIVRTYPQVSGTYITAELKYMQSRGVHVEIWSEVEPLVADTDLISQTDLIVHRGSLTEAVKASTPHILHLHWLDVFDRNEVAIRASDRPVTIRGHSFDFSMGLAKRLSKDTAIRSVYVFQTQAPIIEEAAFIKSVPVCFDPERYYPSHNKDRRLVLRTGVALPTEDLESLVQTAILCPEHRFVLCTYSTEGDPNYLELILKLNQTMGSPVEILVGQPVTEIASIMRQAAIYLHSYNSLNSVMPISIAEAMATGALTLARQSEGGVPYLGTADRLYKRVEDAAAIIRASAGWDDDRWAKEANFSIERAFNLYAPTQSAQVILDDWLTITDGSYLDAKSSEEVERVAPDQLISFAAGQSGIRMIRTGFHEPEQWGVWTAQKRSTLVFELALEVGQRLEALSIRACASGPRPVTIDLLLNQKHFGTFVANIGLETYSVPINLSTAINEKFFELSFNCNHLWSPSDSGGGDRRILGFALSDMSFMAAAGLVL